LWVVVVGDCVCVALSYLPVARDQQFLLPPDMREWLPAGHFVWFVLEVVERLDTVALHARHRNDGVGRRAYDPEMLLALLVYAYCTGLRSSRQIERRCETDVAFRVLCAGSGPDHTTIARFRQNHTGEAVRLFTDVLMLCENAGLASVGVVAVDGTKMAANASLSANRSRETIEAEVAAILAEAETVDGVEDTLFGECRGDELPAELINPSSRGARLDAALRQLEAAAAARRAEQAAAHDAWTRDQAAAAERGRRSMKRPPPELAVAAAEAAVAQEDERAEAKVRVREVREAEAAAKGRKLRGVKPAHRETAGQRRARKTLARAKAKAAARAKEYSVKSKGNTTDPESRVMKTQLGWVQGYNAQAAVNEHGVVIAAELTQEVNDSLQCKPLMAAIQANLTAIGVDRTVDLLLFDAGYISTQNLTAPGPERLIATGNKRTLTNKATTTGDPPPDATPLEAMDHRLRTPAGRSTYKLRGQLVEPYFGIIKDARGFRRFMRRGLENVTAEWRLIAATHNIVKLYTTSALQPT
jgi:transposase